jgi:hypothetical protein
MTLEQAIEHAEWLGKQLPQTGCVREHARLAGWLRELQRNRCALREIAAGNLDGETQEQYAERCRFLAGEALRKESEVSDGVLPRADH